jgi:hypothetical protein
MDQRKRNRITQLWHGLSFTYRNVLISAPSDVVRSTETRSHLLSYRTASDSSIPDSLPHCLEAVIRQINEEMIVIVFLKGIENNT